MAHERPSRLIWTGARLADGRPVEWYADMPARDLSEAETAALTDEQVGRALASGLYQGPADMPPPSPADEPPPASGTRRPKPGKED